MSAWLEKIKYEVLTQYINGEKQMSICRYLQAKYGLSLGFGITLLRQVIEESGGE